jgi:hypothetical protein
MEINLRNEQRAVSKMVIAPIDAATGLHLTAMMKFGPTELGRCLHPS